LAPRHPDSLDEFLEGLEPLSEEAISLANEELYAMRRERREAR
jgi:hypothetical protein